jgi:hypothetical protein
MGRKIVAGVMSGLIGGLAFDALMYAIPAAGGTSMIAFAADAVHPSNSLIGWLVYPVYGIVIGAFFGGLLYSQTVDDAWATLWGGLYGVGWWIIAQLVLIPILFAIRPLSSSAIDRVRDVALPLLVGHVVYGVILGFGWSRITRLAIRRRRPSEADRPARRAA